MNVFLSGYRQVTSLHNKHKIVHAYGHELSVCLFSCNENWRYSKEKEQEPKAQISLYIEWKRFSLVNNMPRYKT